MNRRDFVKGGLGSAAALTALQTGSFAAATEDTPTDLFHLMQVAPVQVVQVVGLCDVDRRMVDQVVELVAGRQSSGKRPPTYGDYRKLLAEQKPDIVLVGTPDHWHCLPMVEACKAGRGIANERTCSGANARSAIS